MVLQVKKKPNIFEQIGGFINDNVIKPVVSDVGKAVNTASIPITGLVGTGLVLGDKAFNGGKNSQSLVNATLAQQNENQKNSFVPANVMSGKATPGEFLGSVAQTGVNLAPYAIPGVGGAVDKLGTKTAGSLISKGAPKVVSKLAGTGAKAVAGGAIATPTFAGINAVQQGVNSGFHSFDPGQANMAGLQAGAIATASELGIKGAKATIPAVGKGAKVAVKTVNEGRPSVIAAQHPAVQELQTNLALLRQHDEQLARNGLSPNSAPRINNAKAQASTLQEINNTTKLLTRQIAQNGSIKIPGANNETTPLNHFTTPESAEALNNGAAFDYTKNPVHGTGSKDLSDARTGKLVDDGQPALYLSLDDKSWQTASTPNPNATKVVLPSLDDVVKFQKEGGSVGFNYKTQQYEGSKDAAIKTDLSPIQYHVDPKAKTLVIDSVNAFKRAQQLAGQRADSPQFWSQLRKQYDVVDIKNVAKIIKETSVDDENKFARGFFSGAKADQKIVLNPNVVSKKPFSLNPTLNSAKPKVAIKQSPSEVSVEQQMADALGMSPKELQKAIAGPDQEAIAKERIKANNTPQPPIVPEGKTAKEAIPLQPKYEAPRTPEENTALNPTKITIPDVEPGNTEQVRVNAQLASEPIRYEANFGARLARKLTSQEKQDFPEMVEGTKPIKSKEAQAAVNAYRRMTDQAHAINQSLGGNTNYKQNYYHRQWDLSDPKMAEKYDKILQKSSYVDPYNFKGINAQPQAFKTVAEGEAAGFHLVNKGDPVKDFETYGNSASYALRQQAIRKGIDQADQLNTGKNVSFDLGNGESVPVSKATAKGIKGLSNHAPTDNPIVKGARVVNKGTKQFVLGGTQFHPINIGVLRAGPELALTGHPIRAVKGTVSMFASQASPRFNDYLRTKAAQDGLPEFAARIGIPYGSNDFATTGVNSIAGHGLIFGKAMPAMQDQMLRSIKSDLDKKGIPYDSPQAHQAGLVANKVLGFLNTTVQNLDPRAQRVVSDWVFAPQFTRSGLELFRDAFRTGLGGKYARAAIVGNVLATTAVIGAIGAATGQNSDDVRDLLLRAIIDPAAPTPLKDDNGNTIRFKTPGTLTSMVAKLLGIGLTRGTDGHLSVTWNPKNVPSSIADFARSHLSELPANALKIATNTNYAGKPLYDPNAKPGTQIAQGATSIATGLLPIGAQSLPYVPAVKQLFPKDVQTVLDANTPGTDPILKSLASSLGATAATDKTVGKGLSTSRYYDQVDQAKQGLDRQASDALDLYFGSKKNPVTGAYDVKPNANDSRVKATALLQNPTALDHIIIANQNLAKEGENVDPLFSLSKDQITKYFQYTAMAPGSADKIDWVNKNPWYEGSPNNPNDGGLVAKRNDFFSSLPAGDPNKPKLDIQYPEASAAVKALQTTYSGLAQTDKGQFIQAHPELVDQWAKQSDYTNKMREALGYSPLKNYPEASDSLNKYITNYTAADKSTRAGIRNGDTQNYKKMIGYFDSIDLYNINKAGALNQLQGEPDQTSEQNKAISNLAKDIYQMPNGSYSIQPAGYLDGLSNSTSQKSKHKYKSRYSRTVRAKEIVTPKVTFKGKSAISKTSTTGKHKVSIKKSLT